ncbi:hypothetical protein OH76DRAFT_1351066, partial [Lentinus brumalis]
DIGPFANCSQFRLTDWWYGHSGTKSMVDYDDLLDTDGIFSVHDGWHNSSVFVPLPKTHSRHKKEAQAPQLRVDGVYHRNFLSMIEGVVSDASTPYANNIHWLPHELWWYPADIPESSERTPTPKPPPEPIRVYTDCYNSSAMLEEDAQLRQQPRNPDDSPDVDYCVLPILIWSDATQLSSFGNASLWPIYVYFGNLSKYVHGRPTEFAAQHLAYIPGLPDSVQDEYLKAFGVHASPDVLKFCRRELFQQIWLLLLDDEFMAAYEKGILLKCADGMVRRLFPRIFTYSADYPEKILACALKPLSRNLCPRCLVQKDDICEAGTHCDMCRRARNKRMDTAELRERILRARRNAFKGRALGGCFVKKVLNRGSLNPIQSAFSARFSKYKINFYDIFTPDLMHEFELGVWRGTFAHLLRLLQSQGQSAIQEFNSR